MLLLPMPQKINLSSGKFTLAGDIALAIPNPAELLFTAKQLQAAAAHYVGVDLSIRGGAFPAAVTLSLDPAWGQAQGYRLSITDTGVRVVGHDLAGVFYGVMTLKQLLQAHGAALPQLDIEDWPDYANRGVMLDISRDKVPKMETIYHLVDLFAGMKLNQFQLYTEHTFAYQNHPAVWQKASPMTAEEILELDAYCRQRFIELVPNQNSFGHMHRWFEHKPYDELAEVEDEITDPWGSPLPPFSLSPAAPGSIKLLEDLYAELLPNFTSRLFNVGCDETFDLGLGKSKPMIEEKGKGRVYLDFLLQIYECVRAHGRIMMFWGDIINQYPDLVPEIPKDTIALEWGYEADHDFPEKTKLFAESGVPFYVCPGTSSWTTIAGRTDNCTENIRNAAENGLKHGAIGLLNTDWGDRGHWQPLPVSYLGFAYGAALAWAYAPNIEIDIPAALDAFIFEDKAGVMGKLAYDLGNVYQQPGIPVSNGSILFWILQSDVMDNLQESGIYRRVPDEAKALMDDPEQLKAKLHDTIDYIDSVMTPIERADMGRTDAVLVKREFANAALMLRHAARQALMQLGDPQVSKDSLRAELETIIGEYRDLWLARNRPGGLEDSLDQFETARNRLKVTN